MIDKLTTTFECPTPRQFQLLLSKLASDTLPHWHEINMHCKRIGLRNIMHYIILENLSITQDEIQICDSYAIEYSTPTNTTIPINTSFSKQFVQLYIQTKKQEDHATIPSTNVVETSVHTTDHPMWISNTNDQDDVIQYHIQQDIKLLPPTIDVQKNMTNNNIFSEHSNYQLKPNVTSSNQSN